MLGHCGVVVQEHQALAHGLVVGLLERPVQLNENLKHLVPEMSACHKILASFERVVECSSPERASIKVRPMIEYER
jgi:hypothetical protein